MKIRQEGGVRSFNAVRLIGKLDKEVFETQMENVCVNPVEFFVSYLAIKIRLIPGDDRMILRHEADGQSASKLDIQAA